MCYMDFYLSSFQQFFHCPFVCFCTNTDTYTHTHTDTHTMCGKYTQVTKIIKKNRRIINKNRSVIISMGERKGGAHKKNTVCF